MNRNWTDFKSLHGNIAGAREAFEDACESLFRRKYKGLHVSQVRVQHGDGGIDIFVGELGIEPITVIQCKFFLDEFGDSQKAQIRKSFKTANNSDKYELKKWILCIPRVIDIDENAWWFKWKHKQLIKYSKSKDFIEIVNGNELIDLHKELDMYNQVFKIDDKIKIDEIHNAVVQKKIDIPKEITPSLVLFNNYTIKNEQFYIERKCDVHFKESLDLNNIWLFGKSGTGKTALINRNLIQDKIEYCFCDLSPITVKNSYDVLNEILINIEDKFSLERNKTEPNILKQISQILCNCDSIKTAIVIDELSVSEHTILEDIANQIIQLVTHYNNQNKSNGLRFIVSTISDPKLIVHNKSKASGHFQYISCDSWKEYLTKLFDLLINALSLDIEEEKSTIINKSKNSPRILKNIIKKILISNDTSKISISKAIKMSIEEIVE